MSLSVLGTRSSGCGEEACFPLWGQLGLCEQANRCRASHCGTCTLELPGPVPTGSLPLPCPPSLPDGAGPLELAWSEFATTGALALASPVFHVVDTYT